VPDLWLPPSVGGLCYQSPSRGARGYDVLQSRIITNEASESQQYSSMCSPDPCGVASDRWYTRRFREQW
jgi:hypothetical protein